MEAEGRGMWDTSDGVVQLKWDVCLKSQFDQNAWAVVEHERESNITHILPVTPRADVGLVLGYSRAGRRSVRCLMGGRPANEPAHGRGRGRTLWCYTHAPPRTIDFVCGESGEEEDGSGKRLEGGRKHAQVQHSRSPCMD